MKSYIKKLLREFASGLNEDYFDATLPDNIKRLSNRYIGRGVTWYGDPNQMIVIHKDYVDGMWGNIYDSDKLNYVVEFIDMEESLKYTVDNEFGNIGDFRIQLRDGHHRVMGAIEAGENYICVNLDKDDVKLYADKITRVTNKGDR
jgi:hypothetical protein